LHRLHDEWDDACDFIDRVCESIQVTGSETVKAIAVAPAL
jgi:hypothetical protein